MEFALKEPNIIRCRIGAGHNPKANALYEELKKRPVVGTKVTENGWIEFPEKAKSR